MSHDEVALDSFDPSQFAENAPLLPNQGDSDGNERYWDMATQAAQDAQQPLSDGAKLFIGLVVGTALIGALFALYWFVIRQYLPSSTGGSGGSGASSSCGLDETGKACTSKGIKGKCCNGSCCIDNFAEINGGCVCTNLATVTASASVGIDSKRWPS